MEENMRTPRTERLERIRELAQKRRAREEEDAHPRWWGRDEDDEGRPHRLDDEEPRLFRRQAKGEE